MKNFKKGCVRDGSGILLSKERSEKDTADSPAAAKDETVARYKISGSSGESS